MSTPALFKWRRFLPELILLNVRWYCRYSVSYRNSEEMMQERGVELIRVVEDLAAKPNASVPQASRDKAAMQEMYDFFANRRVDADAIIGAHVQ